jgi:hypothetical protein
VAVAGAAEGLGRGSGRRGVGPLVLSPAACARADLLRVPAAEARSLCGRSWDWIEITG